MAEKKITLRRHNGGVAGTLADYDELYPTTTTDQLVSAADGTTQVFDGNHKLKAAYLPDFVFGGMRFVAAIDPQDQGTMDTLSQLASVRTLNQTTDAGKYFIVLQTAVNLAEGTQVGNYIGKWETDEVDDGIDPTTTLTIEAGDWLVVSRVLLNTPSAGVTTVYFSVVNNTYQDASTGGVKGVVSLSGSTSTATTGNAVITDGILNGLIGTTSTKIAAGNHTHSQYQLQDAALDNLVSTMDGASTGFIKKSANDTYSLDTNSYLNASTSSTQAGYFGSVNLVDTTAPLFYLGLSSGSDLTANRTLSLVTGDANRTLTLGGNLSVAGATSITTGALTINAQSGGSTLSLPTTLSVGSVAANGILYGSSANTVGTIASTLIGRNTLTIPDVSVISFARYNADETISMLDAASFRSAIGAGTSSTTGTVTSIATSGAITGGTITTTGTISHSTTDGNLHLPATGTTNNKKFLVAGSTAGSFAWETWPRVYYDTLPTTAQTGDIYIDLD